MSKLQFELDFQRELQKKRALYLVLAQSQPTEDQRLWLSTVVEGFLR